MRAVRHLPGPAAVLVLAIGAFCSSLAVAHAQPLAPGVPVFGVNGYVEYVPGNLPLIFAAPHGGTLQPASIAVRTEAACGDDDFSAMRDANTDELALAIQAAFFGRTGKYPHIVINHLHRNRLDANRPLEDAACGNAEAIQAWTEFQEFINTAKAAVVAQHGSGFFTDLHGHAHAIARLELGYNITATTLRRSDADVDADASVEGSSSIRVFSQDSERAFSALLRGETALGTLFAAGGYPAVPGAQNPAPLQGEAFFSGGYNTREHGCGIGGTICGVQIEANNAGVRDTATNRASFAMKLVEVYDEYLSSNFDIRLPGPPPPTLPGHEVIVDNLAAANDAAWARFAASSNWSNASNSRAWNPPSFRLASASTSATNDSAGFFFMIARPGLYRIESWWPAVSTHSSGAAYRVFEVENGVLFADVLFNQRLNGGQWNELGVFPFSKVGWGEVLLSRSLSTTNGSLAADAVRATLVAADNRAPYARLSAPIRGTEGTPIVFDGTRSFDLDHDALTHSWNFGDGASADSSTATHAFANNGAFGVTLTVTDGHGATGSMLRTVAIANVAPNVAPFAGAIILKGEKYQSSGSFADPGADAWSATVDYGDGAGARFRLEAKQFSLAHMYSAPGIYQVTVDVFDGDDHGRRTAQVVVRSPVEAMTDLLGMVDQLLADAAVSPGGARSLTAKVMAASGFAEKRPAAAATELNAFINQVDALVRMRRLPQSSSALIDHARRIIAAL